MSTFKAGDRVVAINTDISRLIRPPTDGLDIPITCPHGSLRANAIYHVADTINDNDDGGQGVWITGLPVLRGNTPIPWDSSRFRKVDFKRDCAPAVKRKKAPTRAKTPQHTSHTA